MHVHPCAFEGGRGGRGEFQFQIISKKKMRRVKEATKFTIIQVIIDKLVHPRYFLSTIFPPPLLWIIQSFVPNPNPRAKFTFRQEKKTEKIVGKSIVGEEKKRMNRPKSRIGTVQSIEARNQLLNEFIKEEGKKNGGGGFV